MTDDDFNRDDRFNLIAPGRRFHRAMKKQRDERARDGVTRIKRTAAALSEQERLRAQLSEIEVLSRTEAKIGGLVVTLNPVTGELFCSCPSCPAECRHVTTVRDHASRRIK